MDVAMRLEVVERENTVLRERVAALEAVLSDSFRPPVEWGLTGKETQVLGVLAGRPVATKEAILTCVYGGAASADDIPAIKIVDVFICKIRKKVKPFGVNIRTVWGQGYSLDLDTRALLSRHGARAA